MRMRGVRVGTGSFIKKPMATLEYMVVPLLMSTVKIGEELSAAALTRGLGSPGIRTNICKIGFSWLDLGIVIISVTAFIGFLIFK